MTDHIAKVFNGETTLGILGGGQLGKMMALPAANWHLPYWILDKDETVSAAPYATRFVAGDFRKEEDVLRFGRQVDVLTIEIEHVHTGALHQLVKEGVIVHPAPDVLDIIKDKGAQKLFYQKHQLPSSPFILLDNEDAIQQAVEDGRIQLPFVQKSRTGGYDGRGVTVIKTPDDLANNLLPGPALIEELVDIEKELAVVVARNADGEMKSFPVVEMVFDPVANLVDYLLAPAQITQELEQKAIALAEKTAAAYGLSGLLAVELFLTKSGELLINEVAPRPHNSGHHTIESCLTSQFEQHLRGVLNLPLGDTRLLQTAVMLNILGEPGASGPANYSGMKEVLSIPDVFVHLYGKKETRPFRKMGHVTIMAANPQEALLKAEQVKAALKCGEK
ncbi:5-(carboxyamino)imidazole ribonucleotide synthase [Lewinella sp. LCG006]|uniref:5-(carboxyamino)imidazole ribonucleotide synthase n=1 Tax=Lewinella sp. LCG006 TaxID=3231911 RepID=UPI00345F6FFB